MHLRRCFFREWPVWRIEVITGVERRRDWTLEKKRAILAESFAATPASEFLWYSRRQRTAFFRKPTPGAALRCVL